MATRSTCWEEPGVAWLHNGQLYQYEDTKDELVARKFGRWVESCWAASNFYRNPLNDGCWVAGRIYISKPWRNELLVSCLTVLKLSYLPHRVCRYSSTLVKVKAVKTGVSHQILWVQMMQQELFYVEPLNNGSFSSSRILGGLTFGVWKQQFFA